MEELERVCSILRKIEQGGIIHEIETDAVAEPATHSEHKESDITRDRSTKSRFPSIALPRIKDALEYVDTLRPRSNVVVGSADSNRSVLRYTSQRYQETVQRQTVRPDGIVLRTISAALRRRIHRLPKPDEEELKRLEAIEQDLEDIKKTPSMLQVNNPKSVYAALQSAVPTKGAKNMVLEDNLSVMTEKSKCLPRLEPHLDPLVIVRKENVSLQVQSKSESRDSQVEKEGLHGELAVSRAVAASHEKRIRSTLDEVVAFLGLGGPTPQQREQTQAGARQILQTLQVIVNRRLSNSWTVWKEFTDKSTQVLLLASVDRIQRAWRSRFCREELTMRKKRIVQQRRRARLFLDQSITLRVTSALKVQVAFRVYRCKGQVIQMRQRRAAAIKVQCCWRRIQARRKLYNMRIALANLTRCAIIVQCLLRCQWARRHLRLLYKIRSVESTQATKRAAKQVVQERFVRKGAVITLQRWWRRMSRVLLARAMVTVVRRRKVILIQAWWRGSHLRLIRQRERARQQVREKQLSAAALVFQTRYRQKLAVRRLAALKQEKSFIRQGKRAIRPNQLKIINAIRQVRRKWDPLYKTKEQRCARDIQRVFRGYRARKRTSTMRIKKILFQMRMREHAVVRIQIQWRKRIRRRKAAESERSNAASRIQALARSRQAGQLREKLLDMVYAAKAIQRAYRGYTTRRWFRNAREEWRKKHSSAIQAQRLLRGYLSRRCVNGLLEQERWRAETSIKGRRELEIVRRRRTEEKVAFSLDSGVGWDGPVQQIFHAFTKQPKSQLSLEQLVKMLREGVDRKTVELVFSKVKERGQHTLGFEQFTSAIVAISAELSSDKRTVSPTTFVTEMLLCKVWARDINARLEQVVDEKLYVAVSRIQACFRTFHLQKLFIASRSALTACKSERERNRHATKIQTQWRRRVARRKLLTKLERIILKYIDSESGEAFWHNTHTGESTWEKPRILGDSDVDASIALPDADEEFVIQCDNCDQADARFLCYDCKRPFCEDCYRVLHLKGSALRHDAEPIKLCGDCGYQAASRTCETCCAVCCCSCFQTLHAIHNHRWSPVVMQCKECDLRAARFVCDVCEDPLCAKCFTLLHAKGKKRLHTYTTLQYQTLRLDKAQREESEQLRLQAAAAEVQRLRNERKEARVQKSIIRFQARWRGVRARRDGLAFLQQERKRLRQTYINEKRDRTERRRLVYAVKELLGRAPILETDTEADKRRKQHGWKGTKWGSALLRLGLLPAMPVAKQLEGVARLEVGQSDIAIFADLSEEELSPGDWVKAQDYMYQVVSVQKDVERQKKITVVTLDPEVEGEEDSDPAFVRMFNFGKLSAVQRGKQPRANQIRKISTKRYRRSCISEACCTETS